MVLKLHRHNFDSTLRCGLSLQKNEQSELYKSLLEAGRERKEAKELNYRIVLNDDLSKATKEIYEIICRARLEGP